MHQLSQKVGANNLAQRIAIKGCRTRLRKKEKLPQICEHKRPQSFSGWTKQN